MFRFLNKKVQYTVSYNKQINLKPQNYENLFTFIPTIAPRCVYPLLAGIPSVPAIFENIPVGDI